MSAVGDGTAASASASAGAYEGGGAGGKFRKRPLRRNQATPYDRPPTAFRNPSWLTKLVVDPASKLITSGAHRFFSSIFRPSQESQNLPQESRPNEYAGALVVAGKGGDNDACRSGDGTFSELEKLLKQKTFTSSSVGGSGISAFSGCMPAPFSSSASLPSTANFPAFGSVPGTTDQVSASPSNFSFGASSSAFSAAGSSSGPTNGTASVPFTFGASSAAPPKISGPSTSSSATLGIFTFNGTSSASSTNAVTISSSTTPSIFNFGGNSSSSSTSAVNSSATPGIFNVGGISSTANAGNTSSSATRGIFSFGASSSASLTNVGSVVNPSPFNFAATSASSQAPSTAGTFGSSWQPPKSTGFISSLSSSTPSGFTFGASSSSFATPSMSPVVFGSTPSAASGSTFSFGSTSSTNSTSQPMFGNSGFDASPGNNDNMEDSMAEDVVQAPPAPAVSFGQPSVSPSPGGFAFGSAPSTFQFGGQKSQAAPQNSSPFVASSSLVQAAPQNSSPFVASSSLVQAAPQNSSPFAATSNSLEFGGGGSFSLGSSGPDKSGRKIVKVNRNKNRRK